MPRSSPKHPAHAARATRPTLLAGLPAAEYARLRPELEPVRLEVMQVLHDVGERIAHVYFPADSLVGLLTVMRGGKTLESGMVDREGMVGLPVFLGDGIAFQRAVCQQAGAAWRMSARAFRAAVAKDGALAARLRAYANLSLRVAAQFGACGRLHEVEARCASELLMVADRLGADRFPMTQRSTAEVLGVRRASVVAAFGVLARAGLIEHTYGRVTIVDRPGLQAVACECYGTLLADPAALPGTTPRGAGRLVPQPQR